MKSSRHILSEMQKPTTSESSAESTHIYFKPGGYLYYDDCITHGLKHTYVYDLGDVSSDQLGSKAVLGLMKVLDGSSVKWSRNSEKRTMLEVSSDMPDEANRYIMSLDADLVFSESLRLSMQSQTVLDALFWAAIDRKFIDNQPIVIQANQGDATRYQVTNLTCKMHAASKVDGKEPDRVYILGKVLGVGTYGEVYEHKATLKYSYARSQVILKEETVKKKVSKLVYPHHKAGTTGKPYDGDSVKKECAFMRRLGYFGNVRHSKVVIKGEDAGVVVSKKFPGRSLRVLLDEDRYKRVGERYYGDTNKRVNEVDKFKLISVEDRYLLSMSLVKSLHLVHAHSIKHLDIKPDNIIAAKSALSWRTRMIDTGLSEECDEPAKLKGTVLYVAPELDVNLTDKSDVFSLGRLIAILWGDEDFFSCATDAITNADFLQELVGNYSRKLKLFSGMDAGPLTQADLKSISKILHSMVSRYPCDRPRLLGDSSVLDCFQRGYENYLLTNQKLNEQARLDIREVGACARSLDNSLLTLYGQELTGEVLDKIKLAISHSKLSKECGFDGNAIAQKLFKQTLGFRCLESSRLSTFDGIKNRMLFIVNIFAKSRQDLKVKVMELKKEFESSKVCKNHDNKELRCLVDGISVIESKVKKCPPHLDDMHEIAQLMQRKAAKIQAALNRYHEAGKLNDTKVDIGLSSKF